MTVQEQVQAPAAGLPIDVLEALLRQHVSDDKATILNSAAAPLTHHGTNDSTSLVRVALRWVGAVQPARPQSDTWIVKHWRAGGVRDSMLGIREPREVLAWERGWLRPAALPAGLAVPYLAALRSPGGDEAWLAMADVSAELGAYQRLSLPGDLALNQARTILARLAQLHALWERPRHQHELFASAWLQQPGPLLQSSAAQLSPEQRADLAGFLEGRPPEECRLWEHLLADRRTLLHDLAAYPPTLLHNDLDDRNIGLRWPGAAPVAGAATLDGADLILIDWEWATLGPAAIDVANIVQRVPVMVAPGAAIPDSVWSDELPDYYFAHYRLAGGRCTDAAAWRRSFGLALIAQGLIQMPFIHGSLRRALRGELPVPEIVGVPQATIQRNLRAGLPMMEQMEQRLVREARRWLG